MDCGFEFLILMGRRDSSPQLPFPKYCRNINFICFFVLVVLGLLFCILSECYDQKYGSVPDERAYLQRTSSSRKKEAGATNRAAKTANLLVVSISRNATNSINNKSPTISLPDVQSNPDIDPDPVVELDFVIKPLEVQSAQSTTNVPATASSVQNSATKIITVPAPAPRRDHSSASLKRKKSSATSQPSRVSGPNIMSQTVSAEPFRPSREPEKPIATILKIFAAIDSDNVDLIEKMINSHIDWSATNSDGMNALHYAASKMHIRVVTLLLYSRVIDTNSVTSDELRRTALHIVCDKANNSYLGANVAAALFHYGAKVNVLDTKGFTPLSIAVLIDNYQLVRLLITNHANVNHKVDETGRSIIQLARNRTIIKLLLDAGAKSDVAKEFKSERTYYATAVNCVGD